MTPTYRRRNLYPSPWHRRLALVAIVAGIIALVASLSSETLGLLAATALGILGGVCGAVPVSIILVWALVRRTQGSGSSAPQAPQQQYPPVLIVGGNEQPYQLPGMQESPFNRLPAPKRDFRVIPSEDGDWE